MVIGSPSRKPSDRVEPLDEALERGRRLRDRREYKALVHDLTTAISAVSASLAAVLDARVDDETGRRFLENAHHESTRLARVMRSFLSTDEAAASKVAQRRTADLVGALADAVEVVAPLAVERNMTMRICADSAQTRVIAGLPEDNAISLFVGLLENAIKHGREGGQIVARVRALETSCEGEFDDDGPGVEEADRTRIFEFGQRGTDCVGGWGIGLAQARCLLEAHHGDIRVGRSPLGGARFIVRLPREAH